ncbi:MAG: hypothetical protein H6563_16425 [Lewinellaceae bacterium]|nr:hypothetical protein [Lewinellaceae bacterium]
MVKSFFYPFFFVLPFFLQAQPAKQWNMDLLTGIVWSFQMTYETASGKIVDRADSTELCDLLLAPDHSFELFDRDQVIRGVWDLQGNLLQLPFRKVTQFTLAQLTIDQLELHFVVGRTQYAHRFVRAQPVPIPTYQAPEKTPPSQNNQTRTWITGDREIRIELTGGGFFGGADPVQRDFILIKENGRLIHERQTVNSGLQVEKKSLSRRQLTELADFIRSNGFFEMKSRYECSTLECENRLLTQPKPIPLRLAVTDGLDRHVVEVAIWPDGSEGEEFLSVPPALRTIVGTIRGFGE